MSSVLTITHSNVAAAQRDGGRTSLFGPSYRSSGRRGGGSSRASTPRTVDIPRPTSVGGYDARSSTPSAVTGDYSPYDDSTNASGASSGTYRTARPNPKGQYSDTTMDELESQNDNEIEGLSAKVRMLKDLTVRIGDEVRDSHKLAQTLEHSFESTQVKLKSTFKRMRVMAERSGIGWRVWLGFFAFVFLMFFYVWLF